MTENNGRTLVEQFRADLAEDQSTIHDLIEMTKSVLPKKLRYQFEHRETKNMEFAKLRLAVIRRYLEERIERCTYNCRLQQNEKWPFEIQLEIIGENSIFFDIGCFDRIPGPNNEKKKLKTGVFAELSICKVHAEDEEKYFSRRDFGLYEEGNKVGMFNIYNLKELDTILAKFDSWYGSTLD